MNPIFFGSPRRSRSRSSILKIDFKDFTSPFATTGSVSFSAKFGDRSGIFFYEGTFRRSFRLPNRYTILSPFFFVFAARYKKRRLRLLKSRCSS
ncbi:Hsp20/alpha crystallin family protein [Leptospira interrogans]|uniref:Hsp20/alpha crystallin family protein n=1 Tax=Leptospira interrogans TaxID=173 RepID=UPI0002BB8C75|nr:Hsp20/alpha crystallin family protein [Leptospira interrogans]